MTVPCTPGTETDPVTSPITFPQGSHSVTISVQVADLAATLITVSAVGLGVRAACPPCPPDGGPRVPCSAPGALVPAHLAGIWMPGGPRGGMPRVRPRSWCGVLMPTSCPTQIKVPFTVVNVPPEVGTVSGTIQARTAQNAARVSVSATATDPGSDLASLAATLSLNGATVNYPTRTCSGSSCSTDTAEASWVTLACPGTWAITATATDDTPADAKSSTGSLKVRVAAYEVSGLALAAGNAPSENKVKPSLVFTAKHACTAPGAVTLKCKVRRGGAARDRMGLGVRGRKGLRGNVDQSINHHAGMNTWLGRMDLLGISAASLRHAHPHRSQPPQPSLLHPGAPLTGCLGRRHLYGQHRLR